MNNLYGAFDLWRNRYNLREIQYLDFDLNPTAQIQTGRLMWDSINGTLKLGLPGGVVELQLGQEINFIGKNIENIQINDGSPVYVYSASGGVRNIKYAYATDWDITEKTIGLATENIAKNNFGYVTTFGMVNDVDTHSWNEGDTLWLSDTSGQLTNVKPTSNNLIRIGLVVYKHAINGKIFVNVIHEHQKFGDIINGNYSEFEPDGTLISNGDAKVWVDIDFPIVIRTTGANIPSLATLQGNLTMPRWGVNDFNVCEVQEIIHQYAEGTTGYWHIHMITGGTDTTNRYVNWEVEYTWANFDSALPANIIITSGDYLIPANTPALTHLLVPIDTIDLSTAHIGGHIKSRLKRIASTGTAPTSNPFCEMLQMHVEVNTMGSRLISSK